MASASLRRPHRWLGAIPFALLVVACLAVVPSPAQADQIINPKHDNIFLNVSPEEGHRVLISIIYNSFWLGALGWDVFSTIHFDWRVAKETNYRSVFSVCNTLAYWISRYFTFLWVLRVLIDAITLSDDCAGRFRTSASFYGVCVCGTYFVFLLRTANLWRMDLRALVPLMFSMAIMIGFCAPLPYISDPFIAEGSPFCNYRVGGRFSYGVLASCALFDIINFALLYLKLVKSGQGFKGVLKCLQPMTKAAYDHEEVSRMLLQKTFVFVAAQFGLLISLAILYATTTEQNYQLMQVTAFHAISASMGGRIFRRAWKLTREQSPTNIALPPDYSPDWARSRGSAGGGGGAGAGDLVTGGGDGTEGLGGIDGTPVLVKKESKSLRDDASYIEGELNYPVKDTKSILPRTQGRNGSIAASHTSQRSVEDDASQRSQPHAQGAVAIEMGDVAQSSTPVSASSTLAVPPSPFTSQPLKKLGGIGRASRDKRRAATSHGPGVASTDFASGSRQRPSTSYTPISAPVQIISPGADANTSAAFISSKGDGTTPYTTAHDGNTASAASTSSLTITPASIMALAGARQQTQHLGSRSPSKSTLRDARRPRSSSSVVSSSSASTYQPPMLPLDQQPRRSSATPLRTTYVPSPPSSSLTSGNTTRRPSAIDDEQQQAPNPLDAFYTAVHADEARHASGSSSGGAAVPSSPFDMSSGHDADGRPRTSRGGPVAPFGARERTRSHSTDKGVSVLAPPSSAGAAERPTSPARPGTSHGPANTAPAGSFVRLRSPPASSAGRRPGTSSGAADPPPPFGATSSGGGVQHQQRPISPKTVQPPAYIPATATPEPPSSSSAIDEAYRELEHMASLSRSNSIATTSASAHTSSCSG